MCWFWSWLAWSRWSWHCWFWLQFCQYLWTYNGVRRNTPPDKILHQTRVRRNTTPDCNYPTRPHTPMEDKPCSGGVWCLWLSSISTYCTRQSTKDRTFNRISIKPLVHGVRWWRTGVVFRRNTKKNVASQQNNTFVSYPGITASTKTHRTVNLRFTPQVYGSSIQQEVKLSCTMCCLRQYGLSWIFV